MEGLIFLVGMLVVLVVAIRVSSTQEINYGLIDAKKGGIYEAEDLSLSHVRSEPSGGSQNACCPDRVLLGAVT